MIVECHSCGATYNISDEKIRGRRVRVRCKSCSEGIIVDGTRVDSDEATRVYSPTFEPGLYAGRVHDEATRVMAPSGPDLRATASGDEWTVAIGESDRRTMDLAELVSSYTGGLIPDDALVWRDGMDDWLPIRDVPEVKGAIESNEATHVVSPAIAVRAPRRASGDRTGAHPMDPAAELPPPRARMASLSEFTEPAPAAAAPRARSAPVAEVRAPAPASVPRAERIPSARPPANTRPAATARVREGRTGGTDLFGNIEAAGGEEALLGSSALSQYDEKPIGARNESSVLFSLDALKAGARRGSSAPPRTPSSPPQTAADILGMTAGGVLPGISVSTSLLSAPMIDPQMAAVPTTPPRSKMDTLPPTMRARRTWPLPAVVALGALVVGGAAFFILRDRLGGHAQVVETTPTAEERPARPAAAADPTTPVAKPTEPEPPAATAAPAETAPAAETAPPAATAPPPARPSPGAHAQGDGVTAPAIPSRPPATSNTSNIEALKAAMRPDKGEAAAKPAAEKGAGKGAEKVVLAEEGSDTENAQPPAEEPPKPPFDTGAAKSALAAAASSAASCKKEDGPTGPGKVQVTFASTGRATSANVIEGPFGGTSVGGCVAKLFRAAKVPAFSGDPVTVSKSFSIPE